MKKRTGIFLGLLWLTSLIVALLPGAAIAQSSTVSFASVGRAPLGAFSAVRILGMRNTDFEILLWAVVLLFSFIFYVYVSLAVQTIAKKTNTPNPWMAWIPIANIFLLLAIAQKPAWWFILFLIPLVSIIMAIIVWMAVAERRGKPSWWGIMLLIPVMNVIVPGYLAWSK